MALTDTAVRHAKPRAKDYTLPTTTASPFSLIRKAPSAGTSAFPGRISNPVFLLVPILKLAYEMLVLYVILQGPWSPRASIRVSIGSWSVMPGAWPGKSPKKRLFSIESGTQR